MNFLDVREEYKKQREDMRKDLAEYLNGIDTELRIVSGARAGKGWTKYTSDRRIAEYDLSNWKWVEITDDQDFECIVSLNMPDIDPSSGNIHALFDRIGLIVSYHKDGFFYETKIYTDIDLFLIVSDGGGEVKEKIAQLVREQYGIYKQQKEEN